jgi:hypothetical protein
VSNLLGSEHLRSLRCTSVLLNVLQAQRRPKRQNGKFSQEKDGK